MSLIMVFSLIGGNLTGIHAANPPASNADDFPKQETLKYHGKITYENTTVGNFTIGGKQAYCLEHPKTTPGDNTKLTTRIYDNPDIRKVLYYGWEGPAQWSGFNNNKDYGVAATSKVLSHYYNGDSITKTEREFYNFVKDKSVPDFAVKFSKSNVTAYKSGDIQRTETITLASDSSLFGVTIKLDDNMTYVDETHNKRQMGGSVEIKGQTRFHFEAPLNVKMETWKSGTKNASYKFQPLVSKTSSSSLQDIGRGSYLYEPEKKTSLTVNWLQQGSLMISKQDDRGNPVSDTTFAISYNSNMSDPIGSYTTGADGSVSVNNLLPQTVYIQETSVPNHLVLDNTVKSVEIKTGETVSFTQTNNWKQGYIRIVKKDADTGKVVKKAGTGFDIYNSNDQKISTITTNDEGIATSGKLDYGTYYVKEVNAPNGYTIKVDVSENVGVVEDGKTYEIVVSNKQVTGTINISKEDNKTGTAQGDATLEGARYGVYAREDIIDPSGDGSVLFSAGQKVKEFSTDKNGDAIVTGLNLGKYFVKEIEPSYGYNLDETEYDVELAYENQNVSVVTRNMTVYERVISQAFSIVKVSDSDTGETDFLKGAEFTIKWKKDVDALGWDNAPIAKNADGQEAKILVTDERGYAESERLPIGEYVVRETKPPHNFSPVKDFIVTITEDSSEPIPYRVFIDKEFKSVLAIVKEDAETGKTVKVKGATFKIKNTDTNEYFGYWEWSPLPHYVSEWTTTEEGTIMTGKELRPGHYQLEEIASPEGYLLSEEPVPFIIDSNEAYETLPDGVTPVITVKKANVSVKGQISVEKRGEVLTEFNEKTHKFIYEERGLPDAKYNIIAKEDIMDPSNDGTVLYKKGTVIETLTTGKDGKATSMKLPLGKYEVVEISAPDGMVINPEKQTVELKYKDQYTPLVFGTASFVNQRQKVEVEVIKQDNEFAVGLADAEFNFTAKEDIKNYDGEIIVKSGTVINTYISNEFGKVDMTDMDLPLYNNFQLIETKAPDGYVLDPTPVDINTDYQGQDKDKIVISKTKTNKATEVDFSKTDATTGKELSGNHMKIFEKDNEGATFETWVSEDKHHTVKNLSTNTIYVLRETSAVKGFYLQKDIEFIIDQKGTVYLFDDEGNMVPAENNKIVMENDLVKGRLEWNKQGEIFAHTDTGQTEFGKVETPVWEESNLLQSEITIYAAEDITLGNGITYYQKDEKIQTLESDWDPVQSQDLLVGKYYYVESKVPHGYVVDTDKHYFEIKDNQSSELQIVTSTLENNRPTVEIDFTKFMERFEHHNKVDDAYKDVVFGIYAREDIYNYMGEVAIENGTMVGTSGIDELGHLTNVPDLPNGVYYIKELQTNEDYVLDTNEYDFEIAYHGSDVSQYTITIGNGSIENKLIRGTIAIQKNDSFDSEKRLEDVEFNISANEDMSNIISTAKTDENGQAVFKDIEIGKYYIQEANQVDGYVYNDHIYAVAVTTDGEVLTIDVDNKPTEMTFSKVDETGSNELEGATIQIIDKETGNVIDEWVSGKEPHKINYLVEGKEYIMKETIAPEGYMIANEIVFVAGDGKTVTMKDELILTDIQVNKVDSQTMKAIVSKDFEFTMYSDVECKNVISKVNGNPEEGTATFKDVPFGTYYIKETKAPLGYELSNEVKKIVVNNELEGVGDVHSFVYLNTLLPVVVEEVKTGDNAMIVLPCIALAMSGMGIFFISKRKKKEN